jgi:hypothetical protein
MSCIVVDISLLINNNSMWEFHSDWRENIILIQSIEKILKKNHSNFKLSKKLTTNSTKYISAGAACKRRNTHLPPQKLLN